MRVYLPTRELVTIWTRLQTGTPMLQAQVLIDCIQWNASRLISGPRVLTTPKACFQPLSSNLQLELPNILPGGWVRCTKSHATRGSIKGSDGQ